MTAMYLVDSSAIVRLPEPGAARILGPLTLGGQVATCGVVDLELGPLVRDTGLLARIRTLRAASFHWLDITDADLRRALAVDAELSTSGRRLARWPALAVAAVAERHHVTVMHSDPVFDEIAKLTGQAVENLGSRRQEPTSPPWAYPYDKPEVGHGS